MKLKEFADMAGVSVHVCEPGWGGKYAYKTKRHPNSTHCGFKTKEAARMAWLEGEFGDDLSAAILSLLKQSEGAK